MLHLVPHICRMEESGNVSSVFVYVDVLYQFNCPHLLTGLFELRVQEYLESIHENENRRVNRFLKGLGKADSDFWHIMY